jgi:hypothetical protein
MKCITYAASMSLKPGTIERVEDQEAWASVAAGQATYASKEAWKKQQRKKGAKK